MLMDSLPLVEDMEEASTVYSCLQHLLSNRNTAVSHLSVYSTPPCVQVAPILIILRLNLGSFPKLETFGGSYL